MNMKKLEHMITEDYVSFEVSKLLKEKGFDTPVLLKKQLNIVRERAAIAALSGAISDPNTIGTFEQFAESAVGYL